MLSDLSLGNSVGLKGLQINKCRHEYSILAITGISKMMALSTTKTTTLFHVHKALMVYIYCDRFRDVPIEDPPNSHGKMPPPATPYLCWGLNSHCVPVVGMVINLVVVVYILIIGIPYRWDDHPL